MDEILIILRALTNSVESDNSLSKLILTSAIITQREFTFDVSYGVSISDLTLTPNPEDNAFILLTAYKAAILLLQAEMRTSSQQSVKIVDGPSSIDLTSRLKDMKSLLDSLLSDYALMKRDFLLSANEGGSFGYVVMTPTTVSYITGNNFS